MDSTAKKLWANASVRFGVLVLGFMLLMGLAAPWLGTVDPASMDYNQVNTVAGTSDVFINADGDEIEHTFWFGTDHFGRDIYSRVVYGARVSLMVAVSAAVLALLFGSVIGMLSGYFRAFDMALMRVMDGLMAIPAILLAIALVAALGANVATVVVAIAVPEIPRVSRLVRSLVLTLREEPFVEAARALATPTPVILWRHILPNAMAPLIVQGTFVAASAVLLEAILSFLGLGLPPDIPTWGNIMAEGRVQFSEFPGNVLYPACFLVPTVLALNLLGDGLRDVLDPKFAKRGA
ncbi:MAG: ABC transporter permease [Burkholderiaceae bacterium]|jgi:peptide/nickel transport system permease protein|nr:ABC transporter permease [Candidatus Fonsibacter lacus]